MAASLQYDFSSVTALADRAIGLDLTPALRRAAIYQEASTKKNFAAESDPDGKRWADLKPATWLRKKSGTILRESSLGVNSITHYQVNRDTWVVGSNIVYMRSHQFGNPARNLPQRQFLGFSQGDINAINAIFQQYIQGAI